MSPKQQAIKDIKSELKKEGRSFIAYLKKLNPVMKDLVKEQITNQKELSRKKKI